GRSLGRLPHLFQRPRRFEPGVEVGGVERAEADRYVRYAGAIAARATTGADGCEVALGVREEALLRRNIRQQELRLFVVRPDFEDLLVERGGLGVEPLAHQVV